MACQVLADQDLYKCNPEEFKCEKCDPPATGCNFLKPCQATCGKFTPEEMMGAWRGIMSKDKDGPSKHEYGEYDFVFGKDNLIMTD